jgi:hypothetical protein
MPTTRPVPLPATPSQSSFVSHEGRQRHSLTIDTANRSQLALLAQPVDTQNMSSVQTGHIERRRSQLAGQVAAQAQALENTAAVPSADTSVTDKDLSKFYADTLISKYWPLNAAAAQEIIREVQTLLQDKPPGYEQKVTQRAFDFYDRVPADGSWINKARILLEKGGTEDDLKRFAASWSFETKRSDGLARWLTNTDIATANFMVSMAANVPKWLGGTYGNLTAAAASLVMPFQSAGLKVATDMIQEMTRTEPVAIKHPDIGKVPEFKQVQEELATSQRAVITAKNKLQDAVNGFLEKTETASADSADYKECLAAVHQKDRAHADAKSGVEQAFNLYRRKTHGVAHAWKGGMWTTMSNLGSAVTTGVTAAIAGAAPPAAVPASAVNTALQVFMRMWAGAADDRRRNVFDIKPWLVLPGKLLDEEGNIVQAELCKIFNYPQFMLYTGLQQALGYDQFTILEKATAIFEKKTDADQLSTAELKTLESLAGQFAQRSTEIRLLGEAKASPERIKELPKDGKAAQLLKNPMQGIKEAVSSQWNTPGKIDGYVEGGIAQTTLMITPVLLATGLGATLGPHDAAASSETAGAVVGNVEQVASRARVPESKKKQAERFKQCQVYAASKRNLQLDAMLKTYVTLGHDFTAWQVYKNRSWLTRTGDSIAGSPRMIASVARGGRYALQARATKKETEQLEPEFSPRAKTRVSDAVLAKHDDYLIGKSSLSSGGGILPFSRQMAAMASVLYGDRDVLSNVDLRDAYLEREHTKLFVRAQAKSSELMLANGIDRAAIDRFVDETNDAETGIIFLKDTLAPDSQWVGFVREFEDNKGWVTLDGETQVSPSQYLETSLQNGQAWAAVKIPAWIGMTAPATTLLDAEYWTKKLNGVEAPQPKNAPPPGQAWETVRSLTSNAGSGMALSRQKLNDGFYELLTKKGGVKRCLLIYPNNKIIFIQYDAKTQQWNIEQEGEGGEVVTVPYPDIKQFFEQEKKNSYGPQFVSMLVDERKDAGKPDEQEQKSRIVKMLTYRTSYEAARSRTTGTKIDDLREFFRAKLGWDSGLAFSVDDLNDQEFLNEHASRLGITQMVLESETTTPDQEKEFLALKLTAGGWRVFDPRDEARRWQPVEEPLSALVRRHMGNTTSFKCTYQVPDIFADDSSNQSERPASSTADRFSQRFGARGSSSTSRVSFLGVDDAASDLEARVSDGDEDEDDDAGLGTPIRATSPASSEASGYGSTASGVEDKVSSRLVQIGAMQVTITNAPTLKTLAGLERRLEKIANEGDQEARRTEAAETGTNRAMEDEMKNISDAKDAGRITEAEALDEMQKLFREFMGTKAIRDLPAKRNHLDGLATHIDKARTLLFARRVEILSATIKTTPNEHDRRRLESELEQIALQESPEKFASLREFANQYFPA